MGIHREDEPLAGRIILEWVDPIGIEFLESTHVRSGYRQGLVTTTHTSALSVVTTGLTKVVAVLVAYLAIARPDIQPD